MAGDIVFKFRETVKSLYNIISVLTWVCWYKNISMQSWYILNITISFFLADSSSKTRRPTNVIRPPSNLPRVDEEPTTSDQTREVETIDRGVGPTPLPPPIDPRLHQQSPYYGVQPLLDPRNGLLDYPYGNLPYGNSEICQGHLKLKTLSFDLGISSP